MEAVRYEMTIYANEDDAMPLERIKALIGDMDKVGGSPPLELVKGHGHNEEPQPWGLRGVIIGDD